MNWNTLEINIGNVEQGKTYPIKYEYFGSKKIINVRVSCGCSKPDYNEKEKILTVNYTPKDVPYHLKDLGKYQPTQTYVVVYEDDTTEELKLTATVYLKLI
ncbi:MAG: hypothetical protein ACRC0V_07765 [Fusobacteriaceae bacterium]|uniref:hypothetical protein n=1 Tax=Romboutsia sp. TaxID=1965302 RepID=UPI003F414A21